MTSQLKPREIIAKRVGMEFKNNDLVNLGVGIPGLVPSFLPPSINVWLHSENGIIGTGPPAKVEEKDPFCVDASKEFCTIVDGGSVFDSPTSFGIVRGGHLDFTILGAFQVDEKGNLANWKVPNGKLAGMGGAMDLVVGAKKVIVATIHCSRDGSAKILKECKFPLTGEKVVDSIVTEMCFIEVSEKGLILKEYFNNHTIEEIVEKTDANLIIPDNVKHVIL